MMAPGHDGNPGDSGSPSRQDPAGSKKDTTQPPNLTGQMRAPARRVRRRSDPAPGGFVMHWKLDKVPTKFIAFWLSTCLLSVIFFFSHCLSLLGSFDVLFHLSFSLTHECVIHALLISRKK